MSGINTLDSFYKKEGREKLETLLKNHVVIVEKFSACNFYLQRIGNQIYFYRKDDFTPINIVDRTVSRLYENAISFFSRFEYDDFPENHRFGFEYFPNNKPGEIEYSYIPENRLILTRLMIKNNYGKTTKIIDDEKILENWASILNVSHNSSIFAGELSKEQQNSIIEIITNVKTDIKTDFLSLFETYTPPAISNTFDSYIFKISSSTYVKKFKLVDTSKPITEKSSQESRRGTVDSVSILILDVLDYIERFDLPKLISGSSEDEKYIDLISQLFASYMNKSESRVAGMSFDRGDFASSPEFEVNTSTIKNPTALGYLEKSNTNKIIFQILLNSFRKSRDTEMTNDVLTKEVLEDFNLRVTEIKTMIQRGKNEIKTFSEFFRNI